MNNGRNPRGFARDSFWLTALAVLAAAASTPRPSAAQLLPLPLPPVLPGNDPPPPQPPAPAPEQPPPPSSPPEQPPSSPPQQPPSSPPQQPPPSSPPPAESSPPAGDTRFEENDLALGTEGAWQKRGPEVAAFSGGAATSSATSQARATFTFAGSSVVWLGLKCDVCGIANVSLDGGPATSINTAGTAAPGSPGLTSEPVFSAARLAAGTHTLTITVTGTTTTSGAHVVIDAFDVGAAAGNTDQQRPSPPAETLIDDGGAGSGDAMSLALLAASLLLRRRDLSRDHPNSHSEGRLE
ncbi:MAG TPA: hypothetical protein VN818_09630 [Gammaproteobacteria bacterium]|nr:hypothetical protein [Gammaproteobacteria bacterium]